MEDEVFKIGNLDWEKRADVLGKKEAQGVRVNLRSRSTGTLIAKVNQMKYVPDTSAMDTCAGPALLNKLNMAQVTLISPNSQSIVTVNKSMHIMGVVMVEINA